MWFNIVLFYYIHRHADVVISASEQDFNSGYMALARYINKYYYYYYLGLSRHHVRVPPGHDVVTTNPTCPQPGFTLPRRQFVTLNRLRCGQARCTESLYRWGVTASPACPCGESHQTTRHIVEECPLTAFPGGLRRLHEAGPDAVEWLSKLFMKLWQCSKRTTTTLLLVSTCGMTQFSRPLWLEWFNFQVKHKLLFYFQLIF